jgi:hypothetical protein
VFYPGSRGRCAPEVTATANAGFRPSGSGKLRGRRPAPTSASGGRFQAADAERRRIVGDLHDGMQQRLIALRIRLRLAAELIPDDPASAVARIERLGAELDAALAELHTISCTGSTRRCWRTAGSRMR